MDWISDKRLESWAKLIGAVVALIGLFWGMVTFLDMRSREIETRRIEATRPFLERQLALYTEATQAAATLATATDSPEREAAEKRFWRLYWGELALVENKKVEAAMVNMGEALRRGDDQSKFQQLSLKLAHACRDSLAKSWGVAEWETPGQTQ